MLDDQLIHRRDAFLRDGIPHEVYVKCIADARALRCKAVSDVTDAILRRIGWPSKARRETPPRSPGVI